MGYLEAMTPNEKNILKSLVVVAWADGTVKGPEAAMLDGLIWAFDANEEEEAEIIEFAKKKRTMNDDIPLSELTQQDRETLLAHAGLLTHVDGKQTPAEKKVLAGLVKVLEFETDDAKAILKDARQRAAKLATKM